MRWKKQIFMVIRDDTNRVPGTLGWQAMPAQRPFVIVFVVDGLRPDFVSADVTPTLHRLRSEGVDFTNSHAVFPTVTRVNAAALATGMQPGSNGILGNQIYAAEVDPARALDTGNYRRLLELDRVTAGRLVLTDTLGERLHARGLKLAAVSSGSTGSALLTNRERGTASGPSSMAPSTPAKWWDGRPRRARRSLPGSGRRPRGEHPSGSTPWSR